MNKLVAAFISFGFALSLVFLLNVNASAQLTISGFVLDRNNKPIPGVTIMLQRGNTVFASKQAGNDGKYSIPFGVGSTITAVVYWTNGYLTSVINNISGEKSHSISKVLTKSGGIATLTPEDAAEATAALIFLKGYPQIYAAEIAYNEQILKNFPSQMSPTKLSESTYAGLNAINQRINDLIEYKLIFTETINFSGDNANISETEKVKLNNFASKLTNLKSYLIVIIGISNKYPDLENNLHLGGQFTQSVSDYLREKHNIPVKRIVLPAKSEIEAYRKKLEKEGEKISNFASVLVYVDENIIDMKANRNDVKPGPRPN